MLRKSTSCRWTPGVLYLIYPSSSSICAAISSITPHTEMLGLVPFIIPYSVLWGPIAGKYV